MLSLSPSIFTLTAAALLLSGAVASAQEPYRYSRDRYADRRDLSRDYRDVQHDYVQADRLRNDIANDRYRLNQARYYGDRYEAKRIERDIHRDQHALHALERDIHHDRRDIRHDERDLYRDRY